jgi:hypothetical protein
MVARAGGLLATRRLVDSVVFDLCRGPGMVAQVVCARTRAQNAAITQKKEHTSSSRQSAPRYNSTIARQHVSGQRHTASAHRASCHMPPRWDASGAASAAIQPNLTNQKALLKKSPPLGKKRSRKGADPLLVLVT